MAHFLNIHKGINQLVSFKFVILIQFSKMYVKISKAIPYFEETTWLVLMTHFLNVQYVIRWLFSVQRPLSKHPKNLYSPTWASELILYDSHLYIGKS